MSDEKEKESQNQDPTEELSKEDLEKVQGGTPTESVTLPYGKIEWTYTQQKKD
jgi:type VI protein secretion system component Hcp